MTREEWMNELSRRIQEAVLDNDGVQEAATEVTAMGGYLPNADGELPEEFWDELTQVLLIGMAHAMTKMRHFPEPGDIPPPYLKWRG